MLRFLSVPAAALVLVAFGVVNGLWTDRWGVPPDVQAAADRCSRLPLEIDGWHGEDQVINERVRALAGIAGYIRRDYTHPINGTVVSISLICGRPGPISLHPPEVCFSGVGYQLVGDKDKYQATSDPAGPTEFWNARFDKQGAQLESLRVYYGWSDGGNWSAPPPETARVTFARSKYLYKLYVIHHHLSPADRSLKDDPALDDFLRVLLPELRKCLSPSAD
jgi:hypothetical protein